jgi:hypothetical protein
LAFPLPIHFDLALLQRASSKGGAAKNLESFENTLKKKKTTVRPSTNKQDIRFGNTLLDISHGECNDIPSGSFQ